MVLYKCAKLDLNVRMCAPPTSSHSTEHCLRAETPCTLQSTTLSLTPASSSNTPAFWISLAGPGRASRSRLSARGSIVLYVGMISPLAAVDSQTPEAWTKLGRHFAIHTALLYLAYVHNTIHMRCEQSRLVQRRQIAPHPPQPQPPPGGQPVLTQPSREIADHHAPLRLRLRLRNNLRLRLSLPAVPAVPAVA